jgi:hypothetical protein
MRYVHATDQGKRRTVDAAVKAVELENGGTDVALKQKAAG